MFFGCAILIANNSSTHDSISQDTVLLAVIEKAAGKLPKEYLNTVFSDTAVRIHSEIPERFAKPYEKKSWEEYRKLFVTETKINNGIQFHNENRETVHAAAKVFGIDEYIIISIVGVESNYGAHHSEFSVFNSLYTQIQTMPKRQKWATNQMVEYLIFCHNDSINPQEIGGSYAGAFGYGQFIPSSFVAYAVDFNKDGVRNPVDWEDVLGSVANYLKKNGYEAGSKDFDRKSKNWKSVYSYNHSDNYVNAIIELRNAIKRGVETK